MKKSLLALAVLGAFAGAASAQSSVTLFGVVDLNAQFLNNNSVKTYSMGQDGLASSRLGFRGTEDLGGGLSASFWLEGGMNPDVGTTAGQTWRRRSTVSLAGGWGEVRLGRDYTATFWNSTTFDPFGTNGVGSAGNIALVAPGVDAAGNVQTGYGYGTLVRASNMIAYFLPSGIAGGLYGQFQVAAGENVNAQKFVGGRIGYAAGPFNVAAAYGQTYDVYQNAVTRQWANGTNFNIGGSWNFGFMAVAGYYGQLKVDGTTVSDFKQDNWFIGATAPIGLFTLKASYGEVKRSGGGATLLFGQPWNNQKANQFAIGATYDLSKRTAFYATWAGINNKQGAAFVVAPTPNTPPPGLNQYPGGAVANADSQGMQFGVKHSF